MIDIQEVLIELITHYEETMPREVRIAREDGYRYLLHNTPDVSYSLSEVIDIIKDWIMKENIGDIIVKFNGENSDDGPYEQEISIPGSGDNIIENLFGKLYKYIKD